MDRVFLITMIVSLLGHILLFCPWSALKAHKLSKSFQEIEISYFEIKPNPPEEIKQTKAPPAEKKDNNKEITQEQAIKKEAQDEQKKTATSEIDKKENIPLPSLTKEEQMVARDFASLSKEPVFLDYYRAIREKIKISAHRHKPAFFSSGEVYIFFILDKQGELRRLKVIDSKSDPSTVLREAAMRSVEDASSFPPFPQGLNREQISFNIIIAFEVK
jgi:TonB family protein